MGRGEPAVIGFNPRLNALVGGRDTGKSTVVHALRLAARREVDLESLDRHSEPRLAFTRVHWCGKKDECSVEEQIDETGWRPSSVQSVSRSRFPIRIFGQGETATLAGEDQQALLKVVDDAAGGSELQRHLEEAQEAFYASRARIRELDRKLARRDSCLVERQDVGRKLQRFEDAGHAQILTNFKHRTRQREEIDRQLVLTESSAAAISRTADSLNPEDPPPAMFDGQAKDFQPIGQASAGQRSAAMLAFLLAYGAEPLVLDQPEDDLDNQLIYDLIVRQIREQKRNRQIIIVTHNANVVVNGDAEMVHVLDFRNQCFVRHKGSLQREAMRAEVCRVMEGGREAFELRYRRLGPDPADHGASRWPTR